MHAQIISLTKNTNLAEGCSGNPCGTNAMCQESSGRPVCSCPPGHSGNPLTYCSRAECLDNIECRGDLSCRNNHCVNPCIGACASNAICEVNNHIIFDLNIISYFCYNYQPQNHVAVCSCPRGFDGDPFHLCRPINLGKISRILSITLLHVVHMGNV